MAKFIAKTEHFNVVHDTDSVSIQFCADGSMLWNDMVYWDLAEWEEDPTVVFAIVAAVRQVYEEPQKLYDYLDVLGLIGTQ